MDRGSASSQDGDGDRVMQTYKIDIDKFTARQLYRNYRAHASYAEPVDDEIRRAYQLLAQGKLIIRALESIKNAGVDTQGRPKLAIVRADAKECHCDYHSDGRVRFADGPWVRHDQTRHFVELPAGAFPPRTNWVHDIRALVPMIPLHLRPVKPLAGYHILWEAEWQRVVPRDPYLLKRIGKSDLWRVIAQWDLTEVERGALSTRVETQ